MTDGVYTHPRPLRSDRGRELEAKTLYRFGVLTSRERRLYLLGKAVGWEEGRVLKPWRPPVQSITSRIIKYLTESPATTAELALMMPDTTPASVKSRMTTLHKDGRVVAIGPAEPGVRRNLWGITGRVYEN